MSFKNPNTTKHTTYCHTAGLVMLIKWGSYYHTTQYIVIIAPDSVWMKRARLDFWPPQCISRCSSQSHLPTICLPTWILQTTQLYSTQQICSVYWVKLGPPYSPVTDLLWPQPLSQHNKQNEHASLKVINYFTICSLCSRSFTVGVPFRPHIDSYPHINGSL